MENYYQENCCYQIGDWANFTHGSDIIWALHYNNNYEFSADFLLDAAFCSEPVKNLKPILLSKEILVDKNNFIETKTEIGDIYTFKDDKNTFCIFVLLNNCYNEKLSQIMIYKNNTLRYLFRSENLYMHHLQQALRACNITDEELTLWVDKPQYSNE